MSISQRAKIVAAGICFPVFVSLPGCSHQEHSVVQVEAPSMPAPSKTGIKPKREAPVTDSKAVPAPRPAVSPNPTPKPKPTPKPTPTPTSTPSPTPTSTPMETASQTTDSAHLEDNSDPVPFTDGIRPPGPVLDPLADLVQQGTFASALGGMAEYMSVTPSGTINPGLYEDAILLSRLRAGLKAAALEETGFAETAKVSAGVVTLEAPVGTDRSISALAVDTALAIPGVKKVIISLP